MAERDLLAVDASGQVFIWSSQIDTNVELLHESFEAWMHRVAEVIAEGELVIDTPDGDDDRIIYKKTWRYELVGDRLWTPAEG